MQVGIVISLSRCITGKTMHVLSNLSKLQKASSPQSVVFSQIDTKICPQITNVEIQHIVSQIIYCLVMRFEQVQWTEPYLHINTSWGKNKKTNKHRRLRINYWWHGTVELLEMEILIQISHSSKTGLKYSYSNHIPVLSYRLEAPSSCFQESYPTNRYQIYNSILASVYQQSQRRWHRQHTEAGS